MFNTWILSLLAAVALIGSSVMAEELGDPVAGEALYGQCKSCHQIGSGAKHRIGPHLNGIFGRAAASHEGFRYSKALSQVGDAGLEWHADTLNGFIENPRAMVNGTRMSFKGVKSAQDRADIIAYLRGFSDNPADIPEADPTVSATDHDLDPEILALKGDPEYGEYLSSECTTCHRVDGGADGIPSIVLWPEEDFVIAMHAYKNKTRQNPVMQMMASRLNADEIAALAAYFATLEK